jgi:hypothetical protein
LTTDSGAFVVAETVSSSDWRTVASADAMVVVKVTTECGQPGTRREALSGSAGRPDGRDQPAGDEHADQ